jgi:hypothetical protein
MDSHRYPLIPEIRNSAASLENYLLGIDCTLLSANSDGPALPAASKFPRSF